MHVSKKTDVIKPLEMQQNKLIPNNLSEKILMVGIKQNAPGGMAAVVKAYDAYFENMRYITTWTLSTQWIKAYYALNSIIKFFFTLLFNQRIKIVHIQGAANASFARKAIFIRLSALFKKKIIYHMHACDFIPYYDASNKKKWIRSIINTSDCFFVLSNSWKEYFTSIGIDPKKIIVMNNIIEPPVKVHTKKENGIINFLFLGEIGQRKGVYDLLQTIVDNQNLFRNKMKLRIGGNLEEEIIKAFIQDNQISDIASFEGWIAGEKKVECLNWADIYILPSYNEGLPIAILEAMSYSHPIISTPVGGIPEVVKDHQNGILVEPGNLEQIKAALLFFIKHPDTIETYGKKAFDIVQPYFPENVFSQLKDIYNDLLEN